MRHSTKLDSKRSAITTLSQRIDPGTTVTAAPSGHTSINSTKPHPCLSAVAMASTSNFSQLRAQYLHPNSWVVLGSSLSATLKEITAAFRERALQIHPDKSSPDNFEECTELFQLLSSAYTNLIDAAESQSSTEVCASRTAEHRLELAAARDQALFISRSEELTKVRKATGLHVRDKAGQQKRELLKAREEAVKSAEA